MRRRLTSIVAWLATGGSALGRFFHANYFHGNYWHANYWAKP